MLLKDIRDRLDVTPGLSQEDFITRCYATEIFEELMETKRLIVFDDANKLGVITENTLLIGYWDWEMYSDTGNSLFWDDDITMRLFGRKGLTPEEQERLTGGKSLLSLQAEALKKAAMFILTTLKEAGYEPVTATA